MLYHVMNITYLRCGLMGDASTARVSQLFNAYLQIRREGNHDGPGICMRSYDPSRGQGRLATFEYA